MRPIRTLALLVLLLEGGARAQTQDVGHKLLGGLGTHAGFQVPAGVYVGDALVWYGANRVRDRRGAPLPLQGFDLDVVGDVVGFSFVWKLRSTFLSGAVSLPLARVAISSRRPEASVDRFGLGDLYVRPLKLGWRLSHVDLVTSYAFYAPVRHSEPGGVGTLGNPQWTHEFAAGGSVFFTDDRGLYLSALASYELYQRKLHVDLTRGDSVQLQGGFGARVWKLLDVGVAGYALWQVRDDRGAQLPPPLSGARDRTYGLGPDAILTLPRAGLAVNLRYEHDLGARTRPSGQIVILSVAWTHPFQRGSSR